MKYDAGDMMLATFIGALIGFTMTVLLADLAEVDERRTIVEPNVVIDGALFETAIESVKEFEGLSLEPYRCPAGFTTIGYGHRVYGDSACKITADSADRLLRSDFISYIRQVYVSTRATGGELLAMASFAANVGFDRFERSSVKLFYDKGDRDAAANMLLMYVHAAGKKLRGLELRRNFERTLFYAKISDDGR